MTVDAGRRLFQRRNPTHDGAPTLGERGAASDRLLLTERAERGDSDARAELERLERIGY